MTSRSPLRGQSTESRTNAVKLHASDSASHIPLPGPRSLENSTTSMTSLSSLKRDTSSLPAKMEAMEQQMLATHMRACSAGEEAEAAVRSVVDEKLPPVLDELEILRGRVGNLESRSSSTLNASAPDVAIDGLMNRIEQAELRLSTSQSTVAPPSTEMAVLVARLDSSVTVVSRSVDECERRIRDVQQDHTSQWVTLRERIESAEVARGDGTAHLESSIREESCRRGAEVNALRTRLESLEQTLVDVNAKVAAWAEHASALDSQDSRLNTIENSYHEMLPALQVAVRRQEEVPRLLDSELPAVKARLEISERQLQQLQAAAQDTAVDSAAIADSSQDISDILRRLDAAEIQLQQRPADAEPARTDDNIAGLGDLTARFTRLEAALPSGDSPAADGVTRTRSRKVTFTSASGEGLDLQVSLAVLEKEVEALKLMNAATKLEVVPELDSLKRSTAANSKELEVLINSCKELQASAAGDGQKFEDINKELDVLKVSLGETRQDVSKVTTDLASERKERYSALAEVNHLTETVAKAAAETIERAEQRFSDELVVERKRAKQQDGKGDQPDAQKQLGDGFSPGDPVGESPKNAALGSGSSAEANRVAVAMSKCGQQTDIGRDLARCIGEMDAELRVELTGTINAVHKEVDSIRNIWAARLSSIECRVRAVETSCTSSSKTTAELKDVANELGAYARHYSSMLGPTSDAGGLTRDARGLTRQASVEGLRAKTENRVKASVESCETGSTSSSQQRRPYTNDSMSQSTDLQEERSNINSNSDTGFLSDMFKQAMREKPASSPLSSNSAMSDDLKTHLKSLVFAVNRTLGEDRGAPQDLDTSVRRVPSYSKGDAASPKPLAYEDPAARLRSQERNQSCPRNPIRGSRGRSPVADIPQPVLLREGEPRSPRGSTPMRLGNPVASTSSCSSALDGVASGPLCSFTPKELLSRPPGDPRAVTLAVRQEPAHGALGSSSSSSANAPPRSNAPGVSVPPKAAAGARSPSSGLSVTQHAVDFEDQAAAMDRTWPAFRKQTRRGSEPLTAERQTSTTKVPQPSQSPPAPATRTPSLQKHLSPAPSSAQVQQQAGPRPSSGGMSQVVRNAPTQIPAQGARPPVLQTVQPQPQRNTRR